MQPLRLIFLMLSFSFVLSCAQNQTSSSEANAEQTSNKATSDIQSMTNTISGEVLYPQHHLMAEGAHLKILLQAVDGDNTHTIHSHVERLNPHQKPPYAFTMNYDSKEIPEGAMLQLQARLEISGKPIAMGKTAGEADKTTQIELKAIGMNSDHQVPKK